MTVGATHANNFTVTTFFTGFATQLVSFGLMCLIVDKATNTLNGARAKRYTSTAEAQTDRTATYISASTLAAVTAAFLQDPQPEAVMIANLNTAGSETYGACLAAIRAADDGFYAIGTYSRADADVLALAAAVEADDGKKLCILQLNDAGFLTATYPVALAALKAYKKTAWVWHDTTTEHLDVAWGVARLAVANPDTQSAPWSGEVAGVAALATPITSAQRAYLLGHRGNVMLPWPPATSWVGNGTLAYYTTELTVDDRMTADWLATRQSEDFAALVQDLHGRGVKLSLDPIGVAKLQAKCDARMAIGVTAGHFVRKQTLVVVEAVSPSDATARKFRVTTRAQLARSGVILEMTNYLSATAI